jgi:hypothetical protein
MIDANITSIVKKVMTKVHLWILRVIVLLKLVTLWPFYETQCESQNSCSESTLN